MIHPPRADLGGLMQALVDEGVEFIVVGGTAAVLHGAPTTTYDLDVVHRRTPENVRRFLQVLGRLDAIVREPTNRRLRPTESLLNGPGQLLMSTDLGPLDALGQLHDGRGYDDLLPHTIVMVDGTTSIRVLDLDTLIEVKRSAGRNKDKLVLPMLMALKKSRS